ncbi:hypothetical protein, partial [Prevotella sp.]|uniref:hypothetical protein n=1 Tax=Prevotella sp. TaxID=59823 RepID=UPI00307CCC1B
VFGLASAQPSTGFVGCAIIKAGFASTAALPEDVRNGMGQGCHVRLILFLKRGKDGMKHNYVAEVF